MNTSDVHVTVVDGVAEVIVDTPGICVEVRDYDWDDPSNADLWRDEDGRPCVRYFVREPGVAR